MIKLTNQQAAQLNSPIIANLMQDTARPFPMTDAFKLSDILQTITTRLRNYHETSRKIVEDRTGTIDPKTGLITYLEPDQGEEANKMLQELNEVELEYQGDKLKPTEDWPKLTLAEASLLRPIIDNGSKP